MQPVTYILYSEKLDKFYIGYSENFEQRILFHNSDENRKWTKSGKPWVPFLVISCASKGQAMALEKYLKKLKSKKALIELKENPNLIENILTKI